jgi:hypothetical protein
MNASASPQPSQLISPLRTAVQVRRGTKTSFPKHKPAPPGFFTINPTKRGDSMSTNKDSEAIEALDLTLIKMKLMHVESGEGWTEARAKAVETQYRRFLYLMKKYPNEQISPSVDVDTFWHYHILDTMKYAEDCEQAFGYFLHHYPYVGFGEDASPEDQQRSGERMRQLYASEFGAEPITVQSAWCAVTSPAVATAWCAVTAPAVATAWCAVTAPKAGTAWCAAADKRTQAAWCAAAGKRTKNAWCASAGKHTKTAWCAASGKREKTAWCAVSSARDKTAYRYAVTSKNARSAGNAQTAWCAVTAKEGPVSAANGAWCAVAIRQQKTAWCAVTGPSYTDNSARESAAVLPALLAA